METLRLLEMRDGTNMTRLAPRRLLPSPIFRVFFFSPLFLISWKKKKGKCGYFFVFILRAFLFHFRVRVYQRPRISPTTLSVSSLCVSVDNNRTNYFERLLYSTLLTQSSLLQPASVRLTIHQISSLILFDEMFVRWMFEWNDHFHAHRVDEDPEGKRTYYQLAIMIADYHRFRLNRDDDQRTADEVWSRW